MPSVRVPTVLRPLTGGADEVQIPAATVRDALTELDRRHPGFAAKVLHDGAV